MGKKQSSGFKAGDRVEWKTSQGKTSGRVIKKQTSPTKIKGHDVAASRTHPEYLVQSEKSGKKAAHQANALKKIRPAGR
jgi:hypothetical protein